MEEKDEDIPYIGKVVEVKKSMCKTFGPNKSFNKMKIK